VVVRRGEGDDEPAIRVGFVNRSETEEPDEEGRLLITAVTRR